MGRGGGEGRGREGGRGEKDEVRRSEGGGRGG